MAEDGFTTAAALWSGSTLQLEEGRCVNIRGRSEICSRCVKACPKDAIELSLDEVLISDDCTDCGACLPACPAGALKLAGFSPVALLQAVNGRAVAHLHCRESKGGDGGVVLPCHQVLDARLLAAMAGSGCTEIAIHGLENCGTCRHGSAVKNLEKIQRTLSRWLGEDAPVLDLAPQTVQAAKPAKADRQDQIKLDRRNFFRMAGSQVVSSASAWVAPVEEETPDPYAYFNGTLLPADPEPYQTTLGIKVDDIAFKKKSLPIFWREFSDACTLCMACAERCPTGALAPLAGNLAKGIGFASLLCTNCGLCTQVCPFDAVKSGAVRDPEFIAKAPVVLKQLQLVKCSQCAVEFSPTTPEDTLCLTCQNEEEIEDEWLSFMEG
jgi:ferredoxin